MNLGQKNSKKLIWEKIKWKLEINKMEFIGPTKSFVLAFSWYCTYNLYNSFKAKPPRCSKINLNDTIDSWVAVRITLPPTSPAHLSFYPCRSSRSPFPEGSPAGGPPQPGLCRSPPCGEPLPARGS